MDAQTINELNDLCHAYNEDSGNPSSTSNNGKTNPIDLSNHSEVELHDNQEYPSHTFQYENGATPNPRQSEINIFAQFIISYRTLLQISESMKNIIDNHITSFNYSAEATQTEGVLQTPTSENHKKETSHSPRFGKEETTKKRYCYTTEEKSKLFSHFQNNKFPTKNQYSMIACETNMPRSRILQ